VAPAPAINRAISMSETKTTSQAPRLKFAPWLVIAAVVALTTVVLRLEGRLWISASGQFKLWVGDAWGSENSQQLLDPYSFTHVLHGFLLCWLTGWLLSRWPLVWRLCLAIALEAAWEMIENSRFAIEHYRKTTAAVGYSGDTVVNSLADIVSCGVGFWLAARLGWRWSLALFAATEIVLAWWIRDSLLLNILMLVCPLPSVRAWQMGG
jgi:hypothetical protein